MPKKKNAQGNNGKGGAKNNLDDQPIKSAFKKLARLRGMKDITFNEHKFWNIVTKKTKDLADVYGFKEITTPLLENLALYKKTTGETSDIVSKEMYSFVDKNGDKIAIRPEITPSLVRAYIENGMFTLPQPVKMYSIGPIFRHEKPQAGRYRQSTQLDFEIIGENSPIADFLLILVAYNLFSELQVKIQVQINNIGCKVCRKDYIKKLTAYYKERGKRSKLCNDCKKRLVKNPLRLLDCKEKGCVELKEDAPPVIDYLCDDCRKNFTRVLEYLDEMDIPYNLNPSLVRGLDYYNGTVFEFWPIEEGEENATNSLSLGGGGRYDGLVEHMGGRETAACGMGIGLERTVARVKMQKIPINKDNNDLIFIAQLGDTARRKALNLFEELRRAGFKVKEAFTKDSLKAQLEAANALEARMTLILGQKEINDGTILFRDMESGNQEVIDFKKAKTEVEKRVKDWNILK